MATMAVLIVIVLSLILSSTALGHSDGVNFILQNPYNHKIPHGLSNLFASSDSAKGVRRALLEPVEGAYVGVTYNNSVSLEKYSDFIQFKPTTIGAFCHFPMTLEDKKSLRPLLKQVANVNGMLVLTLEPYLGLSFVTERACRELVEFIAPYETLGVSFFLRFGHEMNGAWYPWCQKPTKYKEKFRMVARFVQSFTCRTAMLWAPNNGGSYPFAGVHVCRKWFCSDFNILDTNNDGKLTMEDDMYTPYYPGDDVVDWVGMTMYHWGRKAPWGKNVIPEPNAFWDRLTGNYDGENGNETAVPDFYAMFCNDSVHMKPLAVPEVSAMWNPNSECCDTELAVKSDWWTQLFNVGVDKSGARDVSKWLPRLKMVSWFDERKHEGKLTVDWTFSNNPIVRRKFRQDMLKQVLENGHRYWKVLSGYHRDERLVDASIACKNIKIITNQTITLTVGVPSQGHEAEVGVEIYSVNQDGIPDILFGSGSTIVSGKEKLLVNISITFKEPQDPSWQEGTLYYSAFVRPLQKNPFNRSNMCTSRSSLVAIQAARDGPRPPAPLTPSKLRLREGELTLIVVIITLLVTALYVTTRRHLRAWKQTCNTVGGAFRFAAAEGNISVMEAISKMQGFDVNMGLLGFTALHSAVIQDQVTAVEWLLSRGANVHCKKEENWEDTALHYAAANGFADVARILLQFGANPCLKNFQGATPGDLAWQNNHIQLASALYKAISSTAGFDKQNEGNQLDVPLVVPTLPQGAAPPNEQSSFMYNTPVSLSVQDSQRASHLVKHSLTPVSVPDQEEFDGLNLAIEGSGLMTPLLGKMRNPNDAVQDFIGRVNYGLGTHGTVLKKGTYSWRSLAVICQVAGIVYFMWRARYSINREHLAFSLLFFLAELATFIPSFIFCMEIWTPVERDPRSLQSMCLSPNDFPSVDVYVVCFNEPVTIIEATVCAALNMMYPPAKLQVWVLDDGKRKQVEETCTKLQQEMCLKKSGPYGRGWAKLQYSARIKVEGVSHHAKAGNINSQLLKGMRQGGKQGAFVVVFDCDMIPRPDFLDRVMGHFFEKFEDGWELRRKLAFVQTPQDFYNVGRDDPMGHRAAFFYGPMMQGRDGLGACPCVGTGVVFRRDALISIGGQAFGSITEDYNTAMTFMGAGFSSIYLNERLIYGLAPEDLNAVFKQRLRWAMGSLQILCRDNPLFKPELTIPQSLLFFQSAFQYWLSLPTFLVILAPIIYMFFAMNPIMARVNEFCFFFSLYYSCNRLMIWTAHNGVPNKGLEMWRGTQAWVWTVPNNLKACWKVVTSELWMFKVLGASEIGFTVTKKDAERNIWQGLCTTWVYFLYYAIMTLGVIINLLRFSFGYYSVDYVVGQVVAFAWGALICVYLWPPVSMILKWYEPAVVGKVEWDETPAELADAFHRNTGPAAEVEKQIHPEADVHMQKAIWRKILKNWSTLLQRWFGSPQDGRIDRSIRNLSGSVSLLSRPEFTLMRRDRDSVTFPLVNSITLISLVVVGVLYSLYRTEPVQAFIRFQLVPVIREFKDFWLH